jgi:hypothetical protein
MKRINISQVDALFANGSYPIEFLFYFKTGLDTQKIRRALKKLSAVFWPVFGEYKEGIISFETYDEDEYYIEETVDGEFIIPPTEKEKWEAYSRFSLHDMRKLFRLKVTRFRNGVILVPRMYHLAGDGYSYFYFLSSLAGLTQQTLLPSPSSMMQRFFKPHHNRTILKDFSFRSIEWDASRRNTRFRLANVIVPRKDVDRMIREVSETHDFRISTNDILSARALKELHKKQREMGDETVELTIPIDVRRQVKEYGRRFFGNGIMLHTTKIEEKDIQNFPVDKLAMLIRKAMPLVSTQLYIDYLSRLEDILSEGKPEKFRPFDPDSGYLVTNISRLPTHKLDFGSGPPDFIFPFTGEKNAAAVMAGDENFILRYAF